MFVLHTLIFSLLIADYVYDVLSSRLLDIMLEEECLSDSVCTTKIKASLLLYMEEGEYKIQMGEKERERESVCV